MRASDRAYAALRDEIVDWRLAPGTVLGEVEQAARLGVSRTPLREALGRLAAEGLVEAQGGRGLVVAELSTDDIRELFETRQALEELAARLAARRRDRSVFEGLQEEFRDAAGLTADPAAYYALVARFDDAIDAAATNGYLSAALGGLRTHLVRIRRIARDNPERLAAAAAEHQLIIDAIVDGDSDLAAHATHVHLHRSLQNILATVSDATLRTPSSRTQATRTQTAQTQSTPAQTTPLKNLTKETA
ncbi:GntR family transcriptional regulator [Homoserinimonas aerilata]|uniref:GntR family transcriptional regulator n=1 Tax=Homoserinimonas aerilata TaxID=1162970 RepID=A0A542YGI5_9MICO|nr:GntR family transcriptional regulator [Homoserinimonas aerilata]TQL47208.1 GntR family transcriptional regulator [Homoserinimonas aerilata]